MNTGFGEILRLCPSLDDANNGSDILADLAGNGGDVSLTGVTWEVDTDRQGVRAIRFDNTSDSGYGMVQNTTSGICTLAMWVKFDSSHFATYPCWFDGGGWYLAGRPDNLHFVSMYPQLLFNNASNDLKSGTWMHLTYTFDGSEVKFYLDGVYKRTLPASHFTGIQAFSIGNTITGSADFKGWMDDILYYDRVLTVTEIQSIASKRGFVAGNAVESISITEPTEKVFQRQSDNTVMIPVHGTYVGSPATIEYSFGGSPWALLDATPFNGQFTGAIVISSSGSDLETLSVRFSNSTSVMSSVNIGVGDVFLVVGQSNAAGNNWDDLRVSLEAETNKPVAFINKAVSGSLISSWLPGTTNYNNATHPDIGNIRGILWHQGESDAIIGTDPVTYTNNLLSIAQGMRNVFNVPFLAAQIGQVKYNNVWYNDEVDDIRSAIMSAYGEDVSEGPVLWNVVPLADGLHFSSSPSTAMILNDQWFDDILRECYDTPSQKSPRLTDATFLGNRVTLTFDGAIGEPDTYTTEVFNIFDDDIPISITSAYADDFNTVILETGENLVGPVVVSMGIGSLQNLTSLPSVPEAIDGKPAMPFYDILATSENSTPSLTGSLIGGTMIVLHGDFQLSQISVQVNGEEVLLS